MREIIEKAIKCPVDYSAEFSNKVSKIRDSLAEKLNVNVRHDNDMNYSAGQKLIIPITHNSTEYRIVVIVSSRANLFTIYWLTYQGSNTWKLTNPVTGLNNIEGKIITDLEDLGYVFITGNILNSVVDGSSTSMDSKPATVFEVLFSELI